MIVVDANVVAYAVLPGDQTEAALRAFDRDPEWIAPTRSSGASSSLSGSV